MFMICVSSLEGVEGQHYHPSGSDVSLDIRVDHGERLIIGGLTLDAQGRETLVLPKTAAAWKTFNEASKTRWVKYATANQKEGNGLSGKKTKGINGNKFGFCLAFNHTKVMKPINTSQSPPFMPGYTICGKSTQLTVYLRGCCTNCIHYKTIGHCDNSTKAITQCQTIRSARTDVVHAITSHYMLTSCNFSAAPSTFPSSNYRGPNGLQPVKKIGKYIEGSDIKKGWQTKIVEPTAGAGPPPESKEMTDGK